MSFQRLYIAAKRRLGAFSGPKIFGIGNNKTGTTSLRIAMKELGYTVGVQTPAERLLEDWAKRDFKKIIRHCRTGEFFQDFPFCVPYTFVILDHEFPGSKFILTVRDSPEQWYDSLTRFHSKKWGVDGKIPTKEDLQNATYIWKGRPWEANRYSYDTPESEPYKKDILIRSYVNYNESVIEYFRHRPEDLLILNVAKKGAYKKLGDFLGKDVKQINFPWENKTSDIKI